MSALLTSILLDHSNDKYTWPWQGGQQAAEADKMRKVQDRFGDAIR